MLSNQIVRSTKQDTVNMYDALDKDIARTGQVDRLHETRSLLELDRLIGCTKQGACTN